MRDANANANVRSYTCELPQWGSSQVPSVPFHHGTMASTSAISEEKLAESVRKVPVLFDKCFPESKDIS